ncbi:MAG: hypothetical protein K8S54_12920 [Spirochaetia bacterium]|nr:hypothetical protein [Spirochaetia bacterium]
MDSSLIVLLAFPIPLLLISFFIWIFVRTGKKHPAEEGKTPKFSCVGAGQIGWIWYRGPFIRTAIYDDFMVVCCAKPYHLPFFEIISVEKKKLFFRNIFKINHRSSQCPASIQLFWPKPELALEFLRSKMRVSGD